MISLLMVLKGQLEGLLPTSPLPFMTVPVTQQLHCEEKRRKIISTRRSAATTTKHSKSHLEFRLDNNKIEAAEFIIAWHSEQQQKMIILCLTQIAPVQIFPTLSPAEKKAFSYARSSSPSPMLCCFLFAPRIEAKLNKEKNVYNVRYTYFASY